MRLTAGTLTVVIFAVLVGLTSAYIVRKALSQPAPVAARPPATATIPIASADLPVGRKIALGDIALMRMTEAEMVAQGMQLDQIMASAEQIIGRRVRHEIPQGEAFLTTDLYLEFKGPDVTNLLQPGQRAFEMQIAETHGSGNVDGGSHVDVLFRAAPRKGTANQLEIPEATVTLLEGIEVLAVDHQRPSEADDTGSRWLGSRDQDEIAFLHHKVTLAVTLEQAAVLQTVQGRGEISLIARPDGEVAVSATAPEAYTLERLLNIQPTTFETEIYRGGSREVLSFVDGNLSKRSYFDASDRSDMQLTSAPLEQDDASAQ